MGSYKKMYQWKYTSMVKSKRWSSHDLHARGWQDRNKIPGVDLFDFGQVSSPPLPHLPIMVSFSMYVLFELDT